MEGPPLVSWLAPPLSPLLASFTATDGIWLAVPIVFLGLLVFRPRLIVRPLIWLITHTIYRVSVTGRDIVPKQGAGLLVCNHVSYIDGLLILSAQRRHIRFMVWAPYAKMWGLRHLLKWARVIPIDGSAGPRAIVQALRAASEALAAGELVCIFAEGGLTRTGFLLPFHRGFEQIVKRTPAPIIPVCLDHVWGSIFSYAHGKIVWKWPQEIPYPVSVAFGQPMPPTSPAGEVRMAIQKLSADCAIERTARRLPVHRQFVRTAAKHPFRRCITDTASKQDLNYSTALAGAILLADRLRPILGDEKMVGIWLPPGVGGVLANISVALLGKTSVNLNYTAGPHTVHSAIQQCGIRHVLTSRVFTSKGFKLADPALEVNLEDFRKEVTTAMRLRALLSVILLPGFILDRWVLGLKTHGLHDLATVIFSSGSTGDPKGVMLTHQNIMANAESMIEAIGLEKRDRALGILPFFHSFGFTVTLWVPLMVGASAVFHHDPRQGKEIGELCRTRGCTILLTTPTFLRFYMRRAGKDDFKTVRVLMCGAEKLSQSVAVEFEKNFGVMPLEGYGCTELSPAASANVPDVQVNGTKQIGNKPGSIGQPLPGVAARVVNPETLANLGLEKEGLLLIYGANVMKGYLGKPELTADVIRDGWYVTGDIAKIDEDGFITITGRLSRFAKVGGEMVPLEKIEEELNAITGNSERTFAVSAVPDEKRGERLVVLHVPLNGSDLKGILDQLAGNLPNLWIPDKRDFFEIPELPVLGSGKLDLKRLKELALERAKN